MPNMRLTPPDDGSHIDTTANGRHYKCAVGSTIDVPTFDGLVLEANGWVNVAGPFARVGTTAQRPVHPAKKQTYLDTDLGVVVTFTGNSWTHSLSGGVV